MANEQTNVLITPGRGIITFDKSLVNSSTITNTVSTTQIKYDHMGGLTFLTPLDTSSYVSISAGNVVATRSVSGAKIYAKYDGDIDGTNSDEWSSVYSTTQAYSASWSSGGTEGGSAYTTVNAYSADWNSTYTSVNDASADWDGTYTSVNSNSADWDTAYTSVNSNSADWDGTYTSVNSNSASWNSTYTSVNSNSADWDSTYTSVNTNSADWDSTYTSVNSNSADWDSTYTSVNSNSASWNSTYTSVKDTSADWDSTYTSVNSNSADWDSTYTSVNSNSADWDSTYTSVNSNSADWDSTYTSVNTNSADWDSTYTSVNTNSADWDSTYTSVNTNSASWDSTYTSVNTNSADWDSTYTSVNTNSASWNSVYTTVDTYSAAWLTEGEGNAIYLPLTGGAIVQDVVNAGGRLSVYGGLSAATTENFVIKPNFNPGNSSLIFADTNNNSVGIRTNSPQYTLHVNGDIKGQTGYYSHIAAETKSFYIKHPSKPDMHLQYGSLESPYHGIRLTGSSVITDSTAIVTLPDYVPHLVHADDVVIQLTNYQHNKDIWVDKIEVSLEPFKSQFVVRKGFSILKRPYKFFWSFTAIRKDIPYLQVEV